MNSPPEVSVNVEGQIYGNTKSDLVRKSPQHQPGVVLLFGPCLYLACPSAPGEQNKRSNVFLYQNIQSFSEYQYW